MVLGPELCGAILVLFFSSPLGAHGQVACTGEPRGGCTSISDPQTCSIQPKCFYTNGRTGCLDLASNNPLPLYCWNQTTAQFCRNVAGCSWRAGGSLTGAETPTTEGHKPGFSNATTDVPGKRVPLWYIGITAVVCLCASGVFVGGLICRNRCYSQPRLAQARDRNPARNLQWQVALETMRISPQPRPAPVPFFTADATRWDRWATDALHLFERVGVAVVVNPRGDVGGCVLYLAEAHVGHPLLREEQGLTKAGRPTRWLILRREGEAVLELGPLPATAPQPPSSVPLPQQAEEQQRQGLSAPEQQQQQQQIPQVPPPPPPQRPPGPAPVTDPEL